MISLSWGFPHTLCPWAQEPHFSSAQSYPSPVPAPAALQLDLCLVGVLTDPGSVVDLLLESVYILIGHFCLFCFSYFYEVKYPAIFIHVFVLGLFCLLEVDH